MKRYKINRAIRVNSGASENGIKWEYGGKVDDYSEIIETAKKRFNNTYIGIRVTDTETGEIIKEILRG